MTGQRQSLEQRLREHADAIERGNRSPLCVAIMRAAATDIEAGGLVAELFDGIPDPPRSVPGLRLLAALHHLVLAGDAPGLAPFYPSAGGDRAAAEVWPAALGALEAHAPWVRERLGRTVQTNDPGRAAVLFGALLWATREHPGDVRLLEIGASAGLNLLPDRFAYEAGGTSLGAPASPVRIVEPWMGTPVPDPAGAQERLRIVAREGCDLNPLDPGDPEDRTTLLSYIWPDEPERMARMRAALDLAAQEPRRVAALPAEEWLPEALARRRAGELTVLWQSVMRQYVPAQAWEAVERAVRDAAVARPEPIVWLRMEPAEDWAMRLTAQERPGEPERVLADCGPHGPPVAWLAGQSPSSSP